jgi:hypothetical protein
MGGLCWLERAYGDVVGGAGSVLLARHTDRPANDGFVRPGRSVRVQGAAQLTSRHHRRRGQRIRHLSRGALRHAASGSGNIPSPAIQTLDRISATGSSSSLCFGIHRSRDGTSGRPECSGPENRCVLIDQKTSKSSGRIASATARFTESGHRLKRGTDSISGASGEGSVEKNRCVAISAASGCETPFSRRFRRLAGTISGTIVGPGRFSVTQSVSYT